MNIEKVKIDELKLNTKNPRVIKDEKFKKLVKSIKEFPEMLEVRPIVVDDKMIVFGGNMRLKACREAGMKEVYIIKVSSFTDEQKKQFIIKDNNSYGDWDYEFIKSEWNDFEYNEWLVDPIWTKTNDIDYTSSYDQPTDNNSYGSNNITSNNSSTSDSNNSELLDVDLDAIKDFGVSSAPKATDDDYSTFELVMKHTNKIKLVTCLSEIKNTYSLNKMEDSLVYLIDFYKKNI